MTSDLVRNVTKFNGKNFLAWKFQVHNVLMSAGLNTIVSGTRSIPANTAANSLSRETWLKDDATAKGYIATALEPEILNMLLACETSKAMWDKLCSVHERKTESNKLNLSQQFHAYRMDPKDSVIQHVAKVQNMARQLLDLGENLPENQIMAKILASLPSKFHVFRSSWLSVDPKRQTVDYLEKRLIDEEAILNLQDAESVALAATTKPTKQKGAQKGAKKNKKWNNNTKRQTKDEGCFVCGDKHHFARNCPDRKYKAERGNSSSKRDHDTNDKRDGSHREALALVCELKTDDRGAYHFRIATQFIKIISKFNDF